MHIFCKKKHHLSKMCHDEGKSSLGGCLTFMWSKQWSEAQSWGSFVKLMKNQLDRFLDQVRSQVMVMGCGPLLQWFSELYKKDGRHDAKTSRIRPLPSCAVDVVRSHILRSGSRAVEPQYRVPIRTTTWSVVSSSLSVPWMLLHEMF